MIYLSRKEWKRLSQLNGAFEFIDYSGNDCLIYQGQIFQKAYSQIQDKIEEDAAVPTI